MILYELYVQDPEMHTSLATYFPSLGFAFKIRYPNLLPPPPPWDKIKQNRRDFICIFLIVGWCFGDKQEVANAKNCCKSCHLCICIHVVSIDADFFSN